MPTHVWYAAYGSNLSPERFDRYISGGRPEGALRTYGGCRDTSTPTGRRPTRLHGRVFFGALSPVWGGGMAFYDPTAPGPSYATAYRVTREQFADVWSQECHRPVGVDVPLDAVMAAGTWIGGAALYDRVLYLGELEGEPMLTFTCVEPFPEVNAPSPAYVATIERGLVETHEMAAAAATAYVDGLINSP